MPIKKQIKKNIKKKAVNKKIKKEKKIKVTTTKKNKKKLVNPLETIYKENENQLILLITITSFASCRDPRTSSSTLQVFSFMIIQTKRYRGKTITRNFY